MVNTKTRPLHVWERNTVTIVQETVWTPELVLKKAENLGQTRIRSPALPVRSDLLYSLSYPGLPFAFFFFFFPNVLKNSKLIFYLYFYNFE